MFRTATNPVLFWFWSASFSVRRLSGRMHYYEGVVNDGSLDAVS